MSFTYNLATDTGKVRLEVGDVTNGAGVRPDGSNLEDEELAVWLTREGSVMRAAAAACEALSRQWAAVANTSSGPLREDSGEVAGKWAHRAKELRDAYGHGDANAIAGVIAGGFTREDPAGDE
jgi:hypothetical protein